MRFTITEIIPVFNKTDLVNDDCSVLAQTCLTSIAEASRLASASVAKCRLCEPKHSCLQSAFNFSSGVI